MEIKSMGTLKQRLMQSVLSNISLLGLYGNKRVIFTYHDVSEPSELQHHPHYSTRPAAFIRQIEWISRHFEIVSLGELCDFTSSSRKNKAAITFDDGWKSVHEKAFPWLAERRIPFSVFLNKQAIEENWLWCSNLMIQAKNGNLEYLTRIHRAFFEHDTTMPFSRFIEDPSGIMVSHYPRSTGDNTLFFDETIQAAGLYMSLEQLHDLGRFPFCTIGSHTVSHPVLSHCNTKELQTEIEENNRFLEDLLGRKIDHFALPFGFPQTYTDEVTHVARQFHKHIYTTDRMTVRDTILKPRIGLTSDSNRDLRFFTNLALLLDRRPRTSNGSYVG
jgi:peptidoglycan/xylan/chitin deacetylase (PgdA/CDA1 family)